MKSIIVGTDFSDGSLVAMEIAVDIAKALQCDIELVWVQQERILASDDEQATMRRLADSRMEEMCNKYKEDLKPNILKHKVMTGKVSAVIAEEARQENAPMIVIGTNGASGFEKYWMGSTAVRIVQEAPCPTLSVRQGFDFHKRLERIVVPIRVSTSSREKIRPTALMAKIFKSEVHIVGLLDNGGEAPTLRAYLQQSSEYLTKEGIKHTVVVKKGGSLCDTLLSYANEVKADLLVIHTEQDKFLSNLFLGTNAQQIVHKSQIPVLSSHPEDYINFAR